MHLINILLIFMALFCAPTFATMGGRLSPRLPPNGTTMQQSRRRTWKRSHPVLSTTKRPYWNSKSSYSQQDSISRLRAGGQAAAPTTATTGLDQVVRALLDMFTSCVRVVLPPIVACAKAIIAFYRTLPMDAIIAQTGLVYAFAGGYYPVLFATLNAAQHSGWQTMLRALQDLTEEAQVGLEAATKAQPQDPSLTAKQVFRQKTMVVLASVDPVKINQATGALYTTWLGVSTVLEREFAEIITLSMTLADYLDPITQFLLAPPLYLCVPDEYSQWVPVAIGWACQAAAMTLAWRIQRVLTAYTSAITGGLMFSRATMRMLYKRGFRMFGLVQNNDSYTGLDEIVGLTVGALGLYSQIGNGFDFSVPYPFALVTWPFDWAEKWLEWKVTTSAS